MVWSNIVLGLELFSQLCGNFSQSCGVVYQSEFVGVYGGRCLLYHTVFPAICAVLHGWSFSSISLSCQLRLFVLQVPMLGLLYNCNLRDYLFRSCSFDNHCSHLYKDEAVCVLHIHRVSQRLSGKIVQVGSTLSCWADGVCRGWRWCLGSLPTYSANLD